MSFHIMMIIITSSVNDDHSFASANRHRRNIHEICWNSMQTHASPAPAALLNYADHHSICFRVVICACFMCVCVCVCVCVCEFLCVSVRIDKSAVREMCG